MRELYASKESYCFCLHELLIRPIKGRGYLIARGEILDQGRNVAEILNELGVANQEGIQEHRQEESMGPPKLYPQILYLYFHYLFPFQTTPCNIGIHSFI